jgi:glycosyltransferase involved in cell wall biosynthesis
MKVLHITTNYTGGAGIAARRLHRSLLNEGIDSHLLVLHKPERPTEKNIHSLEDIISSKFGRITFKILDCCNRLYNKYHAGSNYRSFINGPFSLFRLQHAVLFQSADIIHLHWVPKILAYHAVFSEKTKAFAWTMHDMNPFTGGNHYALDGTFDQKLLDENIKRKKRYLKGINLIAISPSKWLANEARQSEVMAGTAVKVIPNIIDTEVFRPSNETEARLDLGIEPSDKKYILFVAENVQDKRKGFLKLLESLHHIEQKDKVVLLVLGKDLEKNLEIGIEVKHLGYISDPLKLATIYNAADLFVISSLEDNLPNTVLESLACGTPVVGYQIGGIPDMVIDGNTGYLADPNKANDLSHKIQAILNDSKPGTFAQRCRNHVIDNFSEKAVLPQINEIYAQLLANRTKD